VDRCREDRVRHVAWALRNAKGFGRSLRKHNETGRVSSLLKAYRNAYGVEVNLLDAGLKNFANLWKIVRKSLAKQILAKSEGPSPRLAKARPKNPGGNEWRDLPKGWTDESRKTFWESLTSRAPKHKVTQCIKRMDGKVSDPGAFCAALADRVTPGWREEAAKERRKKKKKATSQLERAAASLGQPLRTRRDYGERDEEDGDKPRSQLPGTDNMTFAQDEREAPKVASPDWIGLAEMDSLCPPCAAKMRKAGIKRVHASVMRRQMR
jgi:hypothetical protein